MWLLNGQAVCTMPECLLIPKSNQFLKDGTIPPCRSRILDEDVPVFIIGDPAYPLMSYVMKEYAGGGTTQQEQYFGFRVVQCKECDRMCIWKTKG